MTRRIAALFLTTICSGLSGCFSYIYWDRFEKRREPEELISVDLRQDNVIRMMVRYETGESHLVLADLNDSPSMPDYTAVRASFADANDETSSTPLQRIPIIPDIPEASTWYSTRVSPGGELDIYHGNHKYGIFLPRPAPIGCRSPDTYITFIISPIPVALDIVTAPIQLIGLIAFAVFPPYP